MKIGKLDVGSSRAYLTLFGLSWQKQLEVRSNFLFERIQALAILFSLYFLWSALLIHQKGFLDYSKDQILTYVFVMTLLRAWVLACVTDSMPQEIAQGKISDILLRPISYMGYWATQDLANKVLNLLSAIVEITVFVSLVSAPFYVPSRVLNMIGFAFAVAGGMVLYFQFSYLLGLMGFWTAQSWGPRFCFEVVLEFCAGAYFPIDILPKSLQTILRWLPFPYLIFYPVSIYLERVSGPEIGLIFLRQGVWIAILSAVIHWMWKKGLKKYAAEGR